MAKKTYSTVYVDYTQIPEVIEVNGIMYYRIKPKHFDPDKHSTYEYMNTTYYSIVNKDMQTITIDGITYYPVQQEKPGEDYILKTIVEDNVTYYAWINPQTTIDLPSEIYLYNGDDEQGNPIYLLYTTQKPETIDETQVLNVLKPATKYYYVSDSTIPDTITVNNVIYYREMPKQPGENYELKVITKYGVDYYAWVEIEEVYPESIYVDGVTYYRTQPEQPGEGWELVTTEYMGITYYAWIDMNEPEPVLPDMIDVDGITYYKEQPEQPEGNYELRTTEYQGTTYYAWVEIQLGDIYYYLGFEEINESNYTTLSSRITNYPDDDHIDVPDDREYDVYLLVKNDQYFQAKSGMFNINQAQNNDPENPGYLVIDNFDDYKVIKIREASGITINIDFI